LFLLKEKDHHKAKILLKEVPFNNLFARSVIEKHVTGSVYVNDTGEPHTFYVVHPYGMALLFGDANNENFNSGLLDYILNKNNTLKKSSGCRFSLITGTKNSVYCRGLIF